MKEPTERHNCSAAKETIDMGFRKMVIVIGIAALSLAMFSSCATDPGGGTDDASNPATQQESEAIGGEEGFSSSDPIIRYDVYTNGAATVAPDSFSAAMSTNPIDEQFVVDMDTEVPTTTVEIRGFYLHYLDLWKKELNFSLENLKKYLLDKEVVLLDTAQANWERSLESNQTFDSTVIENSDMLLGSQYQYSSVAYLIAQYKERVFHIKYMTYLNETHVSSEVPEPDQTWNMFHAYG